MSEEEVGPELSGYVDRDEFGEWLVVEAGQDLEVPIAERVDVASAYAENGEPMLALRFVFPDDTQLCIAMTLEVYSWVSQNAVRALRDLGVVPDPRSN